MNTTRKNITKLVSLLCILAITQSAFCEPGVRDWWRGWKKGLRAGTKAAEEVGQKSLKAAEQAAQDTVKAAGEVTKKGKPSTYKHVQFNSSASGTYVKTRGRTYYTDAKALKAGTGVVTPPQDKAKVWANVHGQGENVAPVFPSLQALEEALIEYATQRGEADVDRIAYFVPHEQSLEKLPDGPGPYIIWAPPTSRITFIADGVPQNFKGENYVIMQLWDETNNVKGPIRVYDDSVEFWFSRYYLKSIPLSFLQLEEIPTDPQKFWEAIGGKTEYTTKTDLMADIRLFYDMSPDEMRRELRLGNATSKYASYRYKLYTLPVKEIKLNGKIYRQEDSVMVVRNDRDSVEQGIVLSQESPEELSNIIYDLGDNIVTLEDLEKDYINIK